MRRFSMSPNILSNIHKHMGVSIPTGCINASNVQEWMQLQKVVIAWSITGVNLPIPEGVYRKCCLNKSAHIKDTTTLATLLS